MIDFDKMIDNYLKHEFKPKTFGRYYPSEVGLCMRKIWYSYKEPKEIDPELQKVFEVGNIMHDFVVKVLKSEKNPDVDLLKSEFPFKHHLEDFDISGRIDNLILLKLQEKEVLVEVKSSANIDFIQDAAKHNIAQLQLYMHVLGVHDGIMLYIDKRNLKSKVFTIRYNEKAAQMILERFSKLHASLKEDKIPEPEARANRESSWICKLCEHKDSCYAETPKSEKWI